MSEAKRTYSTKGKKDRLEAWKRFNKAATAEKSWMDRRLRWLFIPQAILITAYGYLIVRDCSPNSELLSTLIVWVGFYLALLAFFGVLAGGRMHWKWTTRLNRLASVLNDQDPLVPFGSKPHWPARTSSVIPSLLAILFILSWGVLLVWNTINLSVWQGQGALHFETMHYLFYGLFFGLFLTYGALILAALILVIFCAVRSQDTCDSHCRGDSD